MSDTKYSLNEWIVKWRDGGFRDTDLETQFSAGWYDWFCKDKSLARRLAAMAPKVIRVAKSTKIDCLNTYVFFKNNCPCNGSLYDDFRICDRETGEVIWTIVPSCGHSVAEGQAELWGRENSFEDAIVKGKMKDIYTYFGV